MLYRAILNYIYPWRPLCIIQIINYDSIGSWGIIKSSAQSSKQNRPNVQLFQGSPLLKTPHYLNKDNILLYIIHISSIIGAIYNIYIIFIHLMPSLNTIQTLAITTIQLCQNNTFVRNYYSTDALRTSILTINSTCECFITQQLIIQNRYCTERY